MRYLRFLFISVFFFALSESFAQGNDILDRFEVRQVGNHVQIDFGIIGGASCFGAQLMRGRDTLEFEQVALIPGICGGTDVTEYYTMIDYDPIAGEVGYYKLILGNEGDSDALSILFVPLNDGYSVFPNPVYNESIIQIDNPLSKEWTCEIFDIKGRRVDVLEGNEDQILLLARDYRGGMYQFRLRYADGHLVSGRYVVTWVN